MWFSLKRTTSSWPKPQVSTGNLGGAEGSAVPLTFPGNVESRPTTDLSSRPERTRISCHAPLDKAACAPFFKERRMMFANATQHLQEIRGSVVERPAVSTPVRRVPCSLGKVPCTKGTASAVPHRASTTRALAPEVHLCDHSLQPTNLESVPHRSSSHFPWNVSPSLCHPERSRGICSSADLSWKRGISPRHRFVISTGAYPDFLPRTTGQGRVCAFL